MAGSWDSKDFPDLTEAEYVVRSRKTGQYNCIAWAADDNKHNWWPDPQGVGTWPKDAPREESLIAFQQAYATLGYSPCGTDDSLEEGWEKVAIFLDAGMPTHAAWQRPDGTWSSKMGPFEDIDHKRLDLMVGPPRRAYGKAKTFMKRERRDRVSQES
jgi:hypothetical protein